MQAPTTAASPINQDGAVAPLQTAKEARLAELSVYLSQVMANSTDSLIGKVAYRGYQLGISEVATVRLLKDHFSQLGYELRPLRIARFVKGSRRWAKDQEEAK
jgi:hypothetical protein